MQVFKNFRETRLFTGATRLHQIKSSCNIHTSRLVSVPSQIRESQAEETAWSYDCNRWWWCACDGAGV